MSVKLDSRQRELYIRRYTRTYEYFQGPSDSTVLALPLPSRQGRKKSL